MNPFSAAIGFVASFFFAARESSEEKAAEGSAGRAYEAELKRQFDAYYKEHGTADGFAYRDPGNSR